MKTAYFFYLSFLAILILISCDTTHIPEVKSVNWEQKIKRRRVNHDHEISLKALNESSGIAKSRNFPGVFWSHNDSQDKPRIFAIDAEGNSILDSIEGKEVVIPILGVRNNDWEDITFWGRDILIADLGNNENYRRNLEILRFPEPDPYRTSEVKNIIRYQVKYPDQIWHPTPWRKNFDCEAIFTFQDKVYVLTKNRSDDFTKLYRFNELRSDTVNIPELIDRFDSKGKVTAASMSEDESQLAVLTYDNIWLFTGFKNDSFFDHEVYFWRMKVDQCEAIDFVADDALLVTNEDGKMYDVPTSRLIKLR